MVNPTSLQSLLETLCGEDAALKIEHEQEKEIIHLINKDGVDINQFNEILLCYGLDRIYNKIFFHFLVYGYYDEEEHPRPKFKSYADIITGVDRFLKIAMLAYGNIKLAYSNLSKYSNKMVEAIVNFSPRDKNEYLKRNKPLKEIAPISDTNTYYLGHYIKKEVEEKFKSDESNLLYGLEKKKCDSINFIGKQNYQAYLSFDHMDVYIATSMREKHEYIFVNHTAKKIFENKEIKDLKLRHFDPTQASCDEPVDKGLIEALMLKRAKCLIYLAQETDTLGKDSELASTLAQGKTVVAYIPECNETFFNEYLLDLELAYPDKSEFQRIVNQLKIFEPSLWWSNKELREIFDNERETDMPLLKNTLFNAIKKTYDNRANKLKYHPLSIQVNIQNGVANGLLIVRSIEDCAKLIKNIVLYDMSFDIEEKNINENRYLYLKETISGSIFRVITGDKMLTNSFWNFYVVPSNN